MYYCLKLRMCVDQDSGRGAHCSREVAANREGLCDAHQHAGCIRRSPSTAHVSGWSGPYCCRLACLGLDKGIIEASRNHERRKASSFVTMVLVHRFPTLYPGCLICISGGKISRGEPYSTMIESTSLTTLYRLSRRKEKRLRLSRLVSRMRRWARL